MSPVKLPSVKKYRLPGFEELNYEVKSEDSVTINSPNIPKNKI